MNFEWTPNADATLRSMRDMGCTFDAISKVLGVSRDAARHRYRRVLCDADAREKVLLGHKRYREAEGRPKYRRTDGDKHLALIFKASPSGFPVLNVQSFRRAA